jgi:hypothetical protein
MAAKKDDWMTAGDGYVDIKLSRPMTLNGAKVAVLRMREPTVNDQLAYSAHKGNDAEQELFMMANLMDTIQADLQTLVLRDYKRVQIAYQSFLD